MQMKRSGAAALMGIVAGTACGYSAEGAVVHAPSAQDASARDAIDIAAAMNNARFVGVGDRLELVVPLPMNDEGRAVGAVGRELTVKGVCGPDGAVATPEQLLAHARRDLERMNNPLRGGVPVTVTYGESPRFVVTFDSLDIALVSLFLPSFENAAEYVDSQLDDRVEIRIDLSTADIPGNVIGTASSSAFVFNYETYRAGLRAADDRTPEESNFANALPSGTLPVRYDNSSTTTNESLVVANQTQLRAIFGDTVLSQTTAITIQLDNTADWDFFVYTDNQVDSGDLSLVDVAVHEITHGLGFRSQVQEVGLNPDNRVAGLDVARFRGFPAAFGVVGGAPITVPQFTTFPRWGDNLAFTDQSLYSRPNSGGGIEFIELEGGDFSSGGAFLQPSHLAYKADFDDKLGIMDPIINRGTTYGPGYWGSGEIGPINDMGWKIVRAIDIIGDCNGNGVPDIIDIVNGARDADGDGLLDACEAFFNPTSPSGAYVDRLTETVYDANGITSLFDFFPGSATVLDRFLVTSVDQGYSSSDADTVRVFSGFIEATAPDEYAFRIEHDDDALLEIAGQQFFRPGRGDLNGLLNSASLPAFIQLEQGFHAFKLTVLIRGSDQVRLLRESRSLGGWGPVPPQDLGGTFFDDCNGNGRDDQFDPDADGDGIPDDCEEPDCDGDNIPDSEELDCDNNGVPDDCEPRASFANAFDIGVAGNEDEVLTYGTCNAPEGFRFDTEIAIWASNGDLVAFNDDTLDPCNTNRLSRLDLQLPAGEYFLGVTGYNMEFSDGFGVDLADGFGCADAGNFFLRVGGAGNVIANVASGKMYVTRFEIAEGAGCPVDLVPPYGTLNFFDVAQYFTLFNAGDPEADFAAPFGTLNFFDVSEYISQFNAGCP